MEAAILQSDGEQSHGRVVESEFELVKKCRVELLFYTPDQTSGETIRAMNALAVLDKDS